MSIRLGPDCTRMMYRTHRFISTNRDLHSASGSMGAGQPRIQPYVKRQKAPYLGRRGVSG